MATTPLMPQLPALPKVNSQIATERLVVGSRSAITYDPSTGDLFFFGPTLPNGSTLSTIANQSPTSGSVAAVLSAALDSAIGAAVGTLAVRGASGWTALTPVAAGRVLTDNGAGVVPSWQAAAGGSLQNAYNAGPGITLGAGGPVAITKGINDATSGFTVTVSAGTGLAALFSGASVSCPGAGASSERFGLSATAAGASSVALGNGAIASGTNSVVIGAGATAAGFAQALVIGQLAQAGDTNGIAIGYQASAGAAGAIVIGNGLASSTGTNSITIGQSSFVGSNGAIAVGYNAACQSNYTVAIGFSAGCQTGSESVAIGSGAATYKSQAVAVGGGSQVQGQDSIAIGHNATSNFTGCISLGTDSVATAANQFIAGSTSNSMTNVYFGQGVSNTAPAAYTINGTASSTNGTAGGAIQIAGGLANQAADAGGAINFKVASTGAGLTLTNILTLVAASGPKIGFFNTTAAARPTAFAITNGVVRRVFDPTTVTLQQLGEVVSTLIQVLGATAGYGLVGSNF